MFARFKVAIIQVFLGEEYLVSKNSLGFLQYRLNRNLKIQICLKDQLFTNLLSS